jgi:hypothetical protein
MSNCKTKKCGCLDTGLTTQPPCEHDTPACPNPDPCSETFSDCCVVHDGDGIADLNIQTGDRLCDILQKISLAISNAGGGVTIQSVTTVGNDLVITMTDGTIFTTPLPTTAVPNDPWVNLTAADMTLITPIGAAINSVTSLDLAYKILNVDTIVIKGYVRLDVTVTAINNDVNLNFRWAPFSGSNWFMGTKTLQGTVERVPIAVINPTGGGLTPGQEGVAFGSTLGGPLNFISIGETDLQLPNGNYTIDLHFEFTSQLQ